MTEAAILKAAEISRIILSFYDDCCCTLSPKFAQARKDLGLVRTYRLSLNFGCSKLKRVMFSLQVLKLAILKTCQEKVELLNTKIVYMTRRLTRILIDFFLRTNFRFSPYKSTCTHTCRHACRRGENLMFLKF